MAEYNDPTHVPEIDKEITEGEKDAISIKLANWIRTKMYGLDVREAMARFILWISVLYHRILSITNKLINRQDDVEQKFDKLNDKFNDQIENSTTDGEIIAARRSGVSEKKYQLLGDRLDDMEESHFTLKEKEVGVLITLQDDRFSINFEVQKIIDVSDPIVFSALVIAEIGNTTQDTFYLEKVGEINV